MSRATRSTSSSIAQLNDCDPVSDKTKRMTKKNISMGDVVKSTAVVSRKSVSSKATDTSSQIATRKTKTARYRNPCTTKYLNEVLSNQETLGLKKKSNEMINLVEDNIDQKVIKVESPSCNETVTRTCTSNVSKITGISKPSRTLTENISKGLCLPSFRHYTTVNDLNSQGLFNAYNFTTVCSIDSINFGFACQSCHMVRFKTYSELRLHEDWCGRTVREDKFYNCRTCERKYHSPAVLSRHENECKQHQSQVENNESANPFNFSTIYAPDFRDFPFFCASCHILAFRTLDEMRVHENWCGMVFIGTRGSAVCENCGIAFRNTTVLSGHLQGPPGCTRKNGGTQKRNLSPLKITRIAVDSKRRKLNQSATASKLKKKLTVVLCSKRKCISRKSSASFRKRIKVEKSSLNSLIECSLASQRKIMQITENQLQFTTKQKDDSINYSRKSASQSKKYNIDVDEEMILESAISAADQASCTPGFEDTEKKSCPVCDMIIVGSIDDMCLHLEQFHNLAFGAESRNGGRSMLGRNGPTNCLDCNTLFDTRLEMTRHKQICKKKIITKPSNPRFMCSVCPMISLSRDEFNMHVQTFHGGLDEYQKILFDKTSIYRPTSRESCLPWKHVSENTSKESLSNEIKQEILDEPNKSPVVNVSNVLGVVVPLKSTPRNLIKNIPSGVDSPQEFVACVSNEKSNTDQVAIKKCKVVEKDDDVNHSAIECQGRDSSEAVLRKTSIASSVSPSTQDTVMLDDLVTAKMSLRIENMVASVSVNRTLCTKGSKGCVGKIRDDNNSMEIQSTSTQEVSKKVSNSHLPVVFNISALQNLFIKNGRKRLHLQTSLIPGSDIVASGFEVNTSATLKVKHSTVKNPQISDKKLCENTEQNKLAGAGAISTQCHVGDTTELNVSSEIKRVQVVTDTNDVSDCIGGDEEQKALLLALHLVPSCSVQPPENNVFGTPVVRKSKRQMAKQIDSTENTNVKKSAMEMIANKRDVNSKYENSKYNKDVEAKNNCSELEVASTSISVCKSTKASISKLNKDLKVKNSKDSELIDTSSGARTSVEVSVLPSLSTRSISRLQLGKCSVSISKLTEIKQQRRHTRGSLSLGDSKKRKQSSSEETLSPTLFSRTKKCNKERQIEPVVSMTLTRSDVCATVPQIDHVICDTLVLSGERVAKQSETLSSNVLARPTEFVSEEMGSKESSSSSGLSPLKKNARRNLRILEPIDDEKLKCLECGSILCTAIEIVSHMCPD